MNCSLYGVLSCHSQGLLDTSQYVSGEMAAVEREQKQIDERAAQVEWELRQVMDKGQYSQ